MSALYILFVTVCLSGNCRVEELGTYNTPHTCLVEAQSAIRDALSPEEINSELSWKCDRRRK